ncbi:MAG: tRNA (guanine-N(7)-)-methyltransferase, partial [Desulfuromonadales bacterium]|nr:tRNA (guanine-N(7)-)-methyltransferase [Desulfuromonadales bacterium]
FFASDFDDYAIDVAETIAELPGYRNQLQSKWVHDLPGYPSSKYMQQFLDKGQNIYYIHYQRDPGVSREQLPPTEFSRGFRTDWQKALHA